MYIDTLCLFCLNYLCIHTIQLLWLVVDMVALLIDDGLQLLSNQFHEVHQGLGQVTFELGCGPVRSLSEKYFQLRAKEFGQNLHKTSAGTQENLPLQLSWTKILQF